MRARAYRILRKSMTAAIAFMMAFSLTAVMQVNADSAQSTLQMYFSPQIMDVDTGEIVVDVNIRNVDAAIPNSLGEICGITAAWRYDAERFDIKAAEDGTLPVIIDDNTLIKSMSDVTMTRDDDRVSLVFLDSTLKDNLIDRDGTICRFVLVSKDPIRLWNSDDTYPIRFIEGSIGIVTYHMPSYSVGRYEGAEGIDGKVGGYNIPPALSTPPVDKHLTFTVGEADFIIDGETVTTDASPFISNGELMIPVRFLSEGIGMSVEWNGEIMTASAYADYKTFKISLKDGKTYLNSALRELSQLPAEIGGRIYIPVSAVSVMCPNAAINTTETGVDIYIP